MVIKLNYKILAVFLAVLLLLPGVAYLAGKQMRASAQKDDRIYLPIILYHEVKTFKNGGNVISPYELESDLKFLKKNGYATITMNDLIRYVYDGRPLPEKPIILSFDDGYLNNYTYALPLLKKYGMCAVLSLIGKNTDDFTEIPDDNLDYSHVTWSQASEMLASGCFEIQNHTYNLHTISSKRYGCAKNTGESEEHYEKALTDDLTLCQKEIIEKLGVTPTTFTYPYGKVSDASLPIIKKLGFKASLSCRYGINIITRDPESLYLLKRVSRYHNSPLQKTLATAMKTLKYSR